MRRRTARKTTVRTHMFPSRLLSGIEEGDSGLTGLVGLKSGYICVTTMVLETQESMQ